VSGIAEGGVLKNFCSVKVQKFNRNPNALPTHFSPAFGNTLLCVRPID